MNRKRALRALLPLAAISLLGLAAACSGSEAQDASPAFGPDDLASVMIPADTVQVNEFTMTVDPATVQDRSRDEALANSYNPEVDGADMDAFGWQAEFGKWYFGGGGSPIAYVSTGVAYYETQQGAANDLVKDLEDLQAQIGLTSPRGGMLQSVSAFAVTGTEGARGTVTLVTENGTPIYTTTIKFVRGNLLAGIGIASVDSRDLRAAAEAIAIQMASQITYQLTGQSQTPTPSPTPVPTPSGSVTPAPGA